MPNRFQKEQVKGLSRLLTRWQHERGGKPIPKDLLKRIRAEAKTQTHAHAIREAYYAKRKGGKGE